MPAEPTDDGQLDALRRKKERLEAENARLTAELAAVTAEFAGFQQPPEKIAQDFEREAAAGEPLDRAQNLNEAASYWAMAGDYDKARRRYLDAIADGGPVAADARVWYATFLLEHGDEEEAYDLLEVVFAEGSDDYQVYEIAGEAFAEHGDLEEALRWFESGLERVRVSAADDDARESLTRFRLASGRARIRELLGLPEDETDLGVDQHRARVIADLTQRDLPAKPVRTAVLFFPEHEFAQAIRRWPAMHAYDTFDEHRAAVEHSLRELEPGRSPRVITTTVDGLAEYAARTNANPELPTTRAAFAKQLVDTTHHAAPWPPGRNDPCWCGSDRKYKKCCGRPD
ncbi:SEC-C metal-binding domain-containing protein [Nocardia sp. NPDC059246]|uniref:SEC-C metal-binding domain-containing protein n=1 Tax=unclassified Nocardia TaxID=2637762 RepID=UPI0036AC4AA0